MPRRLALAILVFAIAVGMVPVIASAVPADQVQQWPFASVFQLPVEAQRGITVGTTTNSPNPTNMLDVTGSAAVSGAVSTGALSATSVAIGASSTQTPAPIKGIYSGTGTWDPASISATPGTAAYATVTVRNAAGGDNTLASFGPLLVGGTPIAVNGVVVTGAITAADTCTVAIQNWTGSALDLSSGTVRCTVQQH